MNRLPSDSSRLHRLAARLLIVLWLPFCCCQLQGAWAMVSGPDAADLAGGCGSGCCDATVDGGDRTNPADDAGPEEPCAASCCVRGESAPPKWTLPAGRLLEAGAFDRASPPTPPASIDGTAHGEAAPDPPWSRPTRARVRLQV